MPVPHAGRLRNELAGAVPSVPLDAPAADFFADPSGPVLSIGAHP